MDATDHEERSTDPGRFEGLRQPVVQTPRSAGEVIGSGLALIALLIGLPVLLLVLAGPPPIPTGTPSMRDFVQQLSFEDLIKVLFAVVWLVWAYFVVCVVVEVVAARRGGLAKPLVLAGPLQKLAQVLVGALLMSGIVAGTANAATIDNATTPAPVAASATHWTGVDEAADATEQAPSAATTADATASPDSLEGKKVYTVAAPKDGYHDNLWDIAENHLGDGRRYKEIYELNKDHVQADGRKLELARLIQPGWHLIMPDDAIGVAVVDASAPATPPPLTVETLTAGLDTTATVAHADGGTSGAQDTVVDSSDNGVWLSGIGLLAAGIIGSLAVQRRRRLGRRPDEEALEAENEFRMAASLARSTWLDRALRELAATSRQEGKIPPSAYAAIVDDDSVELLLAPAVSETVTGWAALEDGRRWRRERVDVADGPTHHQASPYPALVSLGVDSDGRDVLVDLESAGGVVAIDGDPVAAAEVVAAMAVQSATSPWSDVVSVTAADLPDGLAEIGNERIRVVADLRPELAGFEESIAGLREDVLSGRLRRRGTSPSYLVMCGAVPDDDVAARLAALAGKTRQAFSVVVAGEHQAARWRLHVDELGALSIPQLGLTVMANRIGPHQVQSVAELFEAARAVDSADDAERVNIPMPLHPHDDSVWATATRRVGVLGLVTVQGAGDLPADRADLATELVIYLAMHPEGVHPTVLAGVLWPRGVTADVRDSTIERARTWLGRDVDGSHYLRTDGSGRLMLADSVACDWDCVRTLLIESRRATDPAIEVDLLRRALKLVRGEAFDGVPERRYGWIVRDDVTRTMIRVVVDGAHRLAHLLNDDDDPNGAAQAAESGLRINPGSQLLWRELMRARYAVLGVAGVQQTLDSMSESLRGIPLEAETEALVEEFLPAADSLASGG